MLATDRPAPRSLAGTLIAEHYSVRGDDLLAGGRTIRALAEQFGTPLFIYDAAAMRRSHGQLAETVSGFAAIHFSIKANPNPAIARIFVAQGAGVEIASAGEYDSARLAGAQPDAILFAGPGKRDAELRHVIARGIGEIHVESFEEIDRLEAIAAAQGKTVAVSARINPVAEVQGGAMRMGGKPSPFGFDEERIADVLAALSGKAHLDLRGVHLFAGTQILDADVLLAQWRHGLDVAARIARLMQRPLRSIDLGGGLGIPYYQGDHPLDPAKLRAGVAALVERKAAEPLLRDARVIVEPGRYLAGPGGLYVTRVVASKVSRGTRFVITDGGMHHHLAASGNLGQVVKRDYPIVAPARMRDTGLAPCTVTGPLCTPLDTLARKAELPELAAGDLIAVLQSGAYGLSASPQGFLSHPAPAEILIDRGEALDISR